MESKDIINTEKANEKLKLNKSKNIFIKILCKNYLVLYKQEYLLK